MHDQSFREMRHMAAGQAEQRSFEAEVAKELYRLANAPASEYEVSTDRRLRRMTDPAEGSWTDTSAYREGVALVLGCRSGQDEQDCQMQEHSW